VSTESIARWLAALEARHLSNLRFPEVSRALRALSSAYVERRQAVTTALDGRGKRAAFALFYAPLHFLTVGHIVRALDARPPHNSTVIDVGCGTGVCGAAWALAQQSPPRLVGVDNHGYAVQEARWTYAQLGLAATVRRGDCSHLPQVRGSQAIIAGWVLNEMPPETRTRAWEALLEAVGRGTPVLGRCDEWRFPAELPAIVAKLDRAAGLSHRELTARSCYFPGR
jgi:hypothetical protein